MLLAGRIACSRAAGQELRLGSVARSGKPRGSCRKTGASVFRVRASSGQDAQEDIQMDDCSKEEKATLNQVAIVLCNAQARSVAQGLFPLVCWIRTPAAFSAAYAQACALVSHHHAELVAGAADGCFPPVHPVHRPQGPTNVGAVARICQNFGLADLRLVRIPSLLVSRRCHLRRHSAPFTTTSHAV